ncbi:PAS domain-containing sensor histidine kinase [Roseomonas sp. M0104]|uniref:histidine kinase n=1 Tax=Teichococcus coralli TaxID=2545983 RepID=A0A845B924_9PROT|nr:PAS-domain containing protein [Pseudoroseomonas coralli]MXP64113.1 PAS domain-containing sensor histidine kinase [Pseudoroseomonas coralli]
MTDAAPFPEAALQAMPAAACVFDAGGRVVLANEAARRMLDLAAASELLGRSQAEVVRLLAFRGLYGAGDPEAQAAAAMAVDRGRPHHRTLRGTNGRWYDISSVPLPGGGWLGLLTDVTAHRQAEAMALERLRIAHLTLQQTPTGLGLYDSRRQLCLFNEAYERLLGLPQGTLRTGLSFDAIIEIMLEHNPLDEEARRIFAARRQQDRSQPFSSVRVRLDGTAIRSVSQPVPGGGFLVSLEDVTPLRQAEDEAKRRAALLDGVLAAMPHGVCVYGPDHRVRMVNAAFQQIMAGSEVAIGEHLMDVCRRREENREYLNPEAAEEVFRRQFDFERPPVTRVRRNGTVLTGRTAPLPDGGHLSVVSDVTALHRAEAEAQRRADLLQAMLDSMRHGVCLFDKNNRLVAANQLACRMIGLTAEELAPGTHLSTLRDLQYKRGEFGAGPEAERMYRERAVGKVPRLDRFSRTRADGTVIEVSTDPTPDGGFVRTYADVTEERRARAEIERARAAAEEADAAKTRFLATMSHELRTPLNAVIGFSEALAAEPGPPHVTEFAGSILEAGRHLLSLIDEVLDVAQAGTGAVRVATRPLYLPSVLEGVLRLMRGAAEAAQVRLELAPLPELPRALAEERRLRQVLLNLLANAVKFTPAGGMVHLAAAALPDGAVEIRVSDTGIGIEAGQVERAFEPFVQLETSHARRYQGSGLGLYLARALAQAMGATLTLESLRGEGTTARLRLAAATQPQEQTA